jgi:hypothetical protein
MDTDGDGLIDGKTLAKGLASIGFEISPDDLQEFLVVVQVGPGV